MSVVPLLLGLVAGAPPTPAAPARATVAALRTEHKVDPLGTNLELPAPSLPAAP